MACGSRRFSKQIEERGWSVALPSWTRLLSAFEEGLWLNEWASWCSPFLLPLPLFTCGSYVFLYIGCQQGRCIFPV
ncbi:hypothetical protein Y1Q_0011671 [Alligator mississippiensis]|uniref:Uncharacterized protein n=1 Tax=Alligator mississippiensis TaxID=8496 RepID=A0A151M0N1_ALLMI|nr:hypothetical protein Y1Q_0011671 [Alligator mississippiensis]